MPNYTRRPKRVEYLKKKKRLSIVGDGSAVGYGVREEDDGAKTVCSVAAPKLRKLRLMQWGNEVDRVESGLRITVCQLAVETTLVPLLGGGRRPGYLLLRQPHCAPSMIGLPGESRLNSGARTILHWGWLSNRSPILESGGASGNRAMKLGR